MLIVIEKTKMLNCYTYCKYWNLANKTSTWI